MRTWLPLTLSQTNSTANGTIRSSREKRKRVSRDSAEVVQVILRRPLSVEIYRVADAETFLVEGHKHAVCKKHEGAGVLRVWHEMFDVKVIFTLKLKTK